MIVKFEGTKVMKIRVIGFMRINLVYIRFVIHKGNLLKDSLLWDII